MENKGRIAPMVVSVKIAERYLLLSNSISISSERSSVLISAYNFPFFFVMLHEQLITSMIVSGTFLNLSSGVRIRISEKVSVLKPCSIHPLNSRSENASQSASVCRSQKSLICCHVGFATCLISNLIL